MPWARSALRRDTGWGETTGMMDAEECWNVFIVSVGNDWFRSSEPEKTPFVGAHGIDPRPLDQ
jgi:hypothetical protein